MYDALRCDTVILCSLFKVGSKLKMAGVIMNPPNEDERAVIHFLSTDSCKFVAIHRLMVAVYGEKCLSKKNVRDWLRMFRDGREEIAN